MLKESGYFNPRRPPPFFLLISFILFAACAGAFGQDNASSPKPTELTESTEPVSLDNQDPQQNPSADQSATSYVGSNSRASKSEADVGNVAPTEPEPKRILGIIPNFRAVSAGTTPPPASPEQNFMIATKNVFDYSSFIFTGLNSAIAEGLDSRPRLGKGVDGFGSYYWRRFAMKTESNYLVIFALPTIFHQDERYYQLGKGSIWKRIGYSVSRVAITPNYEGHDSFNVSELLGRGMAQGIALAYDHSENRSVGAIATRYGYAILRDAVTNAFREFWPDIAARFQRPTP